VCSSDLHEHGLKVRWSIKTSRPCSVSRSSANIEAGRGCIIISYCRINESITLTRQAGCLSYGADNPCKPERKIGRGSNEERLKRSALHPDPLELNHLLAHTCTPQTANNPSRERPKSGPHFNSRHASHGLEIGRGQGNAKYFDNQGTKRLTLNTNRQEKHYRLVKMLP